MPRRRPAPSNPFGRTSATTSRTTPTCRMAASWWGNCQRRAMCRCTSARTTCCVPATAPRRSNGAPPTPTPRTPPAGRSTTGPSWTASSIPTCRPRRNPSSRSASCRKRSPLIRSPTPATGAKTRRRHRLELSAQGLRQVGELIHQWVRHSVERYGKEEVLTWYWEALERAGHLLLARHARGVQQALRLRRRRRQARAAGGAGGRTGYHRPVERKGRGLPAPVPGALRARNECRHGQNRRTARLRQLPRQGAAGGGGRPRADGA